MNATGKYRDRYEVLDLIERNATEQQIHRLNAKIDEFFSSASSYLPRTFVSEPICK
jgi:hypothetical protein